MTLLRRAVAMAARRMISDPVVQARARRLAEEHVAPRLGEAARRLEPAAARTARRVERAVGELRQAAAEHPPADDPKAFVRAARERLRDGAG